MWLLFQTQVIWFFSNFFDRNASIVAFLILERFLRSRIANNLPSNMPSDVPVLSVDLSRQSYRQQVFFFLQF